MHDLNEIQRLIDQRAYARALDMLREVRAVQSRREVDLAIVSCSAQVHDAAGFTEAVAMFERDRAPVDTGDLAVICTGYSELDLPADGLAFIERCDGSVRDSADAIYHQGLFLLSLHRYDEALAALERRLAIGDDHPSIREGIALALYGVGAWERIAETVAPLEPAFRDWAGNVYLGERLSEAVTSGREALTAYTPGLKTLGDFGAPETGDETLAVYVAGDPAYIKRHLPGLLSSRDNSTPGTPVHVHAFIRNDYQLSRIEKLAKNAGGGPLRITCEIVSAESMTPIHFANARFMAAHALIERGILARPVLMLDIDSEIRGDLVPLGREMAGDGIDVAMRLRRSHTLRQMVAAGAVYLADTAPAARFLATVAAYIAYALASGNARWFLDQLALYIVMDQWPDATARPRVADITRRYLDWDRGEDSLIWVNKG